MIDMELVFIQLAIAVGALTVLNQPVPSDMLTEVIANSAYLSGSAVFTLYTFLFRISFLPIHRSCVRQKTITFFAFPAPLILPLFNRWYRGTSSGWLLSFWRGFTCQLPQAVSTPRGHKISRVISINAKMLVCSWFNLMAVRAFLQACPKKLKSRALLLGPVLAVIACVLTRTLSATRTNNAF